MPLSKQEGENLRVLLNIISEKYYKPEHEVVPRLVKVFSRICCILATLEPPPVHDTEVAPIVGEGVHTPGSLASMVPLLPELLTVQALPVTPSNAPKGS